MFGAAFGNHIQTWLGVMLVMLDMSLINLSEPWMDHVWLTPRHGSNVAWCLSLATCDLPDAMNRSSEAKERSTTEMDASSKRRKNIEGRKFKVERGEKGWRQQWPVRYP
ncbi:hypothetical protein PIB30_041963 [Stylosanthes scabra]|uniref:Secreted protein n=1 Tax=Stylosanthes scabra TaxID=79078 RepID=A0ABU6VE44_9FABA|nr:hypothetical protein [Stylosanthes scabra]